MKYNKLGYFVTSKFRMFLGDRQILNKLSAL